MEDLPSEIVMTAEDMVDASLAGLDQHEAITIPALPDLDDWEKFEAARRALGPNLSRQKPNPEQSVFEQQASYPHRKTEGRK